MDIARFFRISSSALIAFVVVVVVAVGSTWWWGGRKLERKIDVEVQPVAFRDDAASIAHGKYLYESRGCMDCHGVNAAGKQVFDEPNGLRVRAPDLTSANPAIARYQPEDWDRAIRHGVAPSGRPLLIMPSEEYNRLSNDDFAALVAYVRSLPPARGQPAEIRLPWFLRGLYGAGVIQDAAEKIDHRLPPSAPIAATVSASYGAYVANACMGCHGADLRGGNIPGAPPDWPPASDLRPGGVMKRYAQPGQFVTMMRTGKRPDGTEVSRVMPIASFSRMNDTDLNALYLYLTGTQRP
ncbi:Cytochrome C oxidase, cbb3-type, subunit III [Cupriavidus sp. YR651]|uniref:c-type cytochrome n=1 Tax=Cupriavidus sp. YR651 TaxID=1855315 RepID=UPI0008862D22|nr:c-type cytochrome [Cupriavidus sp. YR651]SDC49969.1 Cytochrome C oxidase, cbb3-type, subunit III [Cupriavidus sp. YR651]